MRALLLAGVLALLAPAAYAVDFEIAAGHTKYADRGNGFWYQEGPGLPYDLNLKSTGLQLGVADSITDWLDWHATYVYLGRANSDAIATPDDNNYDFENHRCKGECIAYSRFRGSGDVHGIALTLEPHVDYMGWRLGVSAGPFLYVARWSVTVDDWIPAAGYGPPQNIRADHKAKLNLGAVIGVSIGRGPVSIQYQRFFDMPRSNEPAGDFPPIWRRTDMLSLRYRY